MTRASEAVRRVIQLLTLLVAVLTSVTGTLPPVGHAAATPIATYLPSHTALLEASPEVPFEPARDDGDNGSPGDGLQSDPLTEATIADGRGPVLNFTAVASLSEHAAASHQARAPPAA